MKKIALGVILGNRGFFPAKLVERGRTEILDALKRAGVGAVILSPRETKYGSIETLEDARKCGELFKRNANRIDGILVTLPNFGDERGVAESIRHSGLNVPVLIQATPDDPQNMTAANRRDSFCGKISVCNNLIQYKIPFSLTAKHTIAPQSEEFAEDLRWFGQVCRVVKALKNIRLGAIGSRPAAFNTVRYSEKLLEGAGISVETIDLFEIFGMVDKLKNSSAEVKKKLAEVNRYTSTKGIPPKALLKIAKFGAVLDNWMKENCLSGSAIQCWTAMEKYFGVVPCTIMSMMSDRLLPSACEVDICGAIGMLALQAASGKPSALVDWNNNYGDDADRGVFFHCSNLPKSVFCDLEMKFHAIIAGSVGKANAYGTCEGRIKPGAITMARVSTDDDKGIIKTFVAEGEIEDTPLKTFGGYGVFHIDGLQDLLEMICQEGFEHHVSMNPSTVGRAIEEAFEKYFGWEVYNHNAF